MQKSRAHRKGMVGKLTKMMLQRSPGVTALHLQGITPEMRPRKELGAESGRDSDRNSETVWSP